MNILVTGGMGQLGRCINKISGEYPGHLFFFTDMPETDITDRSRIESLVCGNDIDVIINCAAYTSAEKAEYEGAHDAVIVNTQGPALLADIAAKTGCRLVHISTDYVFGGELRRPLTETDYANPVNVYGVTKLAGEKMVLTSGADAVVVRTSWLYSEFGSNFVKTMLRLSETNDKVSVVDDQWGCPTYAIDLAKALMRLADNGITGTALYHFSNAGETTWHQFAKEIFKQTGRGTEVVPITSQQYLSEARRPAYSVLDTSKIRSAGVVVPQWREALSRCLSALITE